MGYIGCVRPNPVSKSPTREKARPSIDVLNGPQIGFGWTQHLSPRPVLNASVYFSKTEQLNMALGLRAMHVCVLGQGSVGRTRNTCLF